MNCHIVWSSNRNGFHVEYNKALTCQMQTALFCLVKWHRPQCAYACVRTQYTVFAIFCQSFWCILFGSLSFGKPIFRCAWDSACDTFLYIYKYKDIIPSFFLFFLCEYQSFYILVISTHIRSYKRAHWDTHMTPNHTTERRMRKCERERG